MTRGPMFCLTQAYIYDQDGDLTHASHYVQVDREADDYSALAPDYANGPRYMGTPDYHGLVFPTYFGTWEDRMYSREYGW